MRRSARQAIMRGTQWAAPEILFGSLCPRWRLDPRAVATLEPILQAHRFLRARALSLEDWDYLASAWMAGSGGPVGPVGQALASLAELRLGSDLFSWASPWLPYRWDPLNRAWPDTCFALVDHWRRLQCQVLVQRRGDFAPFEAGIEWYLSLRLLRGETPPRGRGGRFALGHGG